MDGQDTSRKTARQSLSTRLLNSLTPAHFCLPSDDTRKLTHVCKERRAVLLELRGYADSDGTNVEPAVATIAKSLGLSARTIFRRLDDLKKLGLLVDEDRLGYDKPRRRHINLLRAQELLGIVREETGRPEGLPECVPTKMWEELASSAWFQDEDVDFLLAGLRHQFHLFEYREKAENFVVALVRFAIDAECIPTDWLAHQVGCRVEGCPGCCLEMFSQGDTESDSDFETRWKREALTGDRIMTRSDFDRKLPGGELNADRNIKPLGRSAEAA